VGSGLGVSCSGACVGAGAAAFRGAPGGGATLGGGVGLGSVACAADPMADAASPDQTAGLGLPVAAVAVSARRIDVAAASKKGATRHGLRLPAFDA
jgi:hypothetical protein